MPPIDASDGPIVVPDTELLFTADYTRVGDDLLLNGADGTTLLIENYFSLEASPGLYSLDGAMLAPGLVATLVASQTPRQFAQTGTIDTEPPIGQVQDVVGTAAAIRDGVPVQLAIGDPLFQNDVLQTGLGSELAIGFADNTIFTLAANARITLDGMIYNPAGGENSLVLSVVQGTFSFVTGQIAPSGEMLIKTPVATIGIRGTIGLGKLASALGPLSIMASTTSGDPTNDVTYEDPETGEILAFISNPASVYEILSRGASVGERLATGEERLEFQTQSDRLPAAQDSFQFGFGSDQPINQPAERTQQSGELDTQDSPQSPDGSPIDTAAGPNTPAGAPLETGAGGDPGQGPGQNASGGIGGIDEPAFGESESNEPEPTTNPPVPQITSQPSSPSNGPSPFVQTAGDPNPGPEPPTGPEISSLTPLVFQSDSVPAAEEPPPSPQADEPIVDQVFVGTDGPDTPVTGPGNDTITTFGGADTISSGAGNDTITPGLGDDSVDAGPGADTVQYAAGDGADDISGGADGDTLIITGDGNANAVNITGTAGDPNLNVEVDGTDVSVTEFEDIVVQGLGGADTVSISGDLTPSGVAQNTVTFEGGDGDDTFDGSAMTSTQSLDLQGGAGDDDLTGGPGDDTIEGGADDDTIEGGGGTDVGVFSGNFADYSLQRLGNGDIQVTDTAGGGQGTDILSNVETLRFDDGDVNAADVVSVDFSIIADFATIAEETGDSATFTVTLSGGPLPLGNTASVTLSPGGGATGGVDYDPALFDAINAAVAGVTGVTFDDTTGVLTFDSAAAFDGNGLASLDFTVTALDDAFFDADETVEVTLSDPVIDIGSAGIGTALAEVTITDINNPPVAVDDFNVQTQEDTAVTIDVLSNDRDPDGQGLTIVGTGVRPGNPSNGMADINLDGTITFTPNPNFFGTATFTYTVEDADGQRDIADVEIIVSPVNDPPAVTLANTVANLAENADTGQAIKVADIVVTDDATGDNVLALTGADADLFEIVGTELFLKAGTALDNAANPSLDVTVTVDDPTVGVSPDDSAALAIAVTDVNTPPSVALANPVANLAETADTSAAIKVADIVIDDDATGNNVLALTGADAALFEIVGTELFLKAGTVLDNTTNPSLDVTVTVDDATVGVSPDDSAALAIAVTDVNTPPTVALANTVANLAENANTGQAIKVADIVITDDGTGTNVLALTGADAALFEIVGTELFLKAGTALDNAANPSLDVTVTVDDATVGVSPDDSAALAIAVTDVNTPPTVALANTVANLAENADTGQAIKVADIVITDDGTGTNVLALTGADAALFEIQGTELFLKAGTALDNAANPSLDVTVTVDDATLGASPDDSAALAIAVTDINEAPAVTLANVVDTLAETANTGAALKVADIVVTDDGTGVNTLALTGADAGLFEIQGTELFLRAGTALDNTANPSLDVTVTVDDATVGVSPDDSADLAIAVTDVNDPPFAADDDFTTDEDTAIVNGNVLEDNNNGADSDPENDALTVTEVNGQAADVGQQITLLSGALLTLNLDGSFDYDPNGAFENLGPNDSDSDNFTYTITDGTGFDRATATIAINGVNDAPAVDLNNDAAGINIDRLFTEGAGAVLLSPGGIVFDPDSGSLDFLSLILTNPQDGAAESLNVDLALAQLRGIGVNGNGAAALTLSGGSTLADYQAVLQGVTYNNISLNPTPGPRTIEVVADDGALTSVPVAVATVTVAAVNSAPTAQDDEFFTDEDTPLITGNVLEDNNFGADSDPENDTLTVTEVNGQAADVGQQITLLSGALLTLNQDGSFEYDPNGAFEGLGPNEIVDDTFTYTITDGNSFSAATAAIRVNGVNDAPQVDSKTVTVDEDSVNNVLGLIAPLDPEGDNLTIQVDQFPDGGAGGAVTLANGIGVENGQALSIDQLLGLVYTPAPDANAEPAQFIYSVFDGTDTVQGTVDFEITPQNDPPFVASTSLTVDEDSQDNVLGLDGPSDVDGDTLTITVVSLPDAARGTVTLADGTPVAPDQILTPAELTGLEYDTLINATGAAGQFVYSIFDGTDTVQGTVDFDITVQNDAPVVDLNGAVDGTNVAQTFNEGLGPIEIAPDGLVIDVDGDDLTTVTVRITNVQDQGAEGLTATTSGGITVSVFADGSLTMTGPAGAAAFQTVLRTVTYNNISANPTPGARTIEVVADDGALTSAPIAVATVTVNPVDSAPVLENNNLDVTEGVLAILDSGNLLAVDADTQPSDLIFNLTNITGGRFFLNTAPAVSVTSFTQAQVNAGIVRFLHDGGEDEPTYSVSVTDGTTTTTPVAAAIVFIPVNDAPAIDLNGLDGAVFTEQLAPAVVDANLTIADPDNATLTGASVTILNFLQPGAEILSPGEFSSPNITVDFNPQIGVLTLSGEDTLAAYQQALRSIIYRNNSDDPTLGGTQTQRTIGFTVNDSATASLAAIATVNLAAVNDAPVNTMPGPQDTAVATDLVLSGAAGNAISIADPDAGANDVQVTLSAGNGTLSLASTLGLTSATGEGTSDVILTGTLAAINAALTAGVTYSSNLVIPGTDTLTVTTDDLGNTGAGGALSDIDRIDITVNDPSNDVILQGLSLTVGDTGTGTFSLSGGESLLLSTVIVGNTAAGIGTLDVTGANTALNVTAGTSLVVGAAGTGTMNINSGAAVTVGTPGSDADMVIGDQATGIGTVTVNAATLSVIGSGGLTVGNEGQGTLRIENGALVESTANAFNNVEIGLGDGGTGTVVVTGTGATLRTLGDDNTVKLAEGVGSTASLTVETGGTVRTAQLEVGRHGQGMATIDGGAMIVSMDDGRFTNPGEDSLAAFVRIGRFGDGVGVVNVINGGLFQVRPDLAGQTSGPGVTLGKILGSSGTIVVNGLGSSFEIVQTNQEFDGGSNGFANGANLVIGAESGQGRLEVINQGSASVTGFSMFRFSVAQNADSSGSVLIDGAGSSLALLANNAKPTVAGLTFADPSVTIGNRGSGDLTVANGGVLSATAVGALEFTIAAASGSTGTVNVQTSAQATVRGDSIEVVVGEDGDGILNVSGGGGFTIDGLGGVFPGLIIGGTDSSTGGGTGTVSVTGTGSSLTLVGDTPFIEVGNLGTGTLTIEDGGSFTGATFLLIGRQPGGVGTLNLSGSTSSIVMSGVVSAAAAAASPTTTEGQGAFLNVGPQGTGTLNITAGADFLISVVESLGASLGAGFNIGGGAGGGGTGTINVDGAGSTLRVAASHVFAGVGRDNVGDLNITNGGLVELLGTDEATLIIGDDPGATGTVTVDGVDAITGVPSTLTVGTPTSVDGQITVGGFDGGFGSLTVSGGAVLNTFFLDVGRGHGGVLSGRLVMTDPGTTVNLNNDFGSFVAPDQTEGGFLRAARENGDVGEIEILNKAVVNVTSGDGVSANGFSGAGIQIARNAGSKGSLLIDDATLNVSDPGPVVDFGSFAQIGRGGEGLATIQNGGALNLTGLDDAFFGVGNEGGAVGVVLLTGQNSKINVDTTQISNGSTTFGSSVKIGRFGDGTLEIAEGGQFTVNSHSNSFFSIGDFAGSTGRVSVDGAGSRLDILTRELSNDQTTFGPGLRVGKEAAGILEITNGGVVNVAGPQPGEVFSSIADFGGSSGRVTVRGSSSLLENDGDLIVGRGRVNDNGTSGDMSDDEGVDGVPTDATLELFGGGAVSVANNLTVAANDVDVTGTVLVSGVSQLGVTNTVNIGTGAGSGTLTIQNGLVPDELVLSTAPVNLRASAINIGAKGTLNLGKGSIDLPGAAVPGTLTNDGVLNLGQGPGLHFMNGNYTQGAAGVLNLRLGEGGNGTAVFGTVDFGAGPAVNLNRIGGAGGARFGDIAVLAAAALAAGTNFSLQDVTVNQLDSGGQPLNDGLDVFGQDVSFDGLPEAVQFTTVTAQTNKILTGITGGLNRTDTDELIAGDVTDSDINVSSTAGNQSLLAINGDIIKNNVQVQRSINVSAEGNTVLALNGSADADFINVGQGGSGTATLLIGSVADVFNLSSVIVGDQGAGLSELFVHGDLSTVDLIIGNAVGAQGRVTVAGGNLSLTSTNTLTVGQEGTGELIVERGGVVNDVGILLIANAAGSSGAVTVTDDGSQLLVDNTLIVANGEFDTGIGFGVPNAATTASLDILDGGFVSALDMHIGRLMNATGSVLVDGVGSTLTVGNLTAIDQVLAVGSFGNGNGTLTVQNGGTVNTFFLAAGNGPGPNSDVLDGAGGATGTIVVTGEGSTINVSNDFGHFGPPDEAEGGFFRVGRMDGDVGRLEVLDHALVRITSGPTESLPALQIARNPGSQGTVIVDNARIEIVQPGLADDFDIGPILDVGRFGKAIVEIRNGAEVLVSGDGAFARVSRGNTDRFADPADAPILDQSRMDINTGGKLIVESGANPDNADINIGQEANASGMIVVDGSNDPVGTRSEILLSGGAAGQQAAFFSVGLRGTGSLSVEGGARVLIDGEAGDFPGMNIGGGSTGTGTGTGTVLVDDVGTELTISGNGALINVGRNGTGLLTVSGGAQVNLIGGAGLDSPSFDLGGTLTSQGTAIVTGLGTSVTLQGEAGNFSGSLDVGRIGNGTLSILAGGTVSNDANGITTIGREEGASGLVLVQGAAATPNDPAAVSTLNAGGFLTVGMDFDFGTVAPSGADTGGSGTLIIGDFGVVNADQIFIGTSGRVQGTGDLNATTVTLDDGVIAAGFSAGTLAINGDFVATSGALEVELGGTVAGQSDLIEIAGAADLQGVQVNLSLIDGYAPLAGDGIAILSTGAGITLNPSQLSLGMAGVGDGFSFDAFTIDAVGDDLIFTANAAIATGNRAFFLGSDLDDTYIGGDGDDDLRGNAGDDLLFGGLGNDFIDGGAGDDLLFGGADADTFVLAPIGDPLSLGDLVTDFEDNLDTIEVRGGGLSFADLTVSDSGGNNSTVTVTATAEVLAVVTVDTGNLLDETDFIFV